MSAEPSLDLINDLFSNLDGITYSPNGLDITSGPLVEDFNMDFDNIDFSGTAAQPVEDPQQDTSALDSLWEQAKVTDFSLEFDVTTAVTGPLFDDFLTFSDEKMDEMITV